MKLNLGCGFNKLPGYLNIDVDESLQPDQIFDFTKKFPYRDDSVDEIVMYHVIEHIQKVFHPIIFHEIHRVLVPGGTLVVSFPEFLECAKNWQENYRGQRDFWEATIYGRQTSPHDHHVSLMHRDTFSNWLINIGFQTLYVGPEPTETYNSVIKAKKVKPHLYQEAMKQTLENKICKM